MSLFNVKRVEKMVIDSLIPNGGLVLLTGKLEIFGVDLFCGSLIYETDEGLQIEKCKPIEPDLGLYQGLQKMNAKVGDILEIKKSRIKGNKKIKHAFEINPVSTNDVKTLGKIKDAIEHFEKEKIDNNKVVF